MKDSTTSVWIYCKNKVQSLDIKSIILDEQYSE